MKNKYNLGEIVYLVTDIDQLPRMVTKICFSGQGVTYQLCQGTNVDVHYEMEISTEKNTMLSLGLPTS